MDEVTVVVARSERATLRVGDVLRKVDADQARIGVEIEVMSLAPVPTPKVPWHRSPGVSSPLTWSPVTAGPHGVGSQSTFPARSAYPTKAPMSRSACAATSGPTRPQRR